MSSSLFRRMAFTAPQSARAFCRLTVIGRIVRQPELQATSTGLELVKFTVVTSHGRKPDAPSSFWDVTSFEDGNRRDFLLNLPKGTMVCLEADAQKRSYKTQEGVQKETVNLTHRNLEVLYRPRIQTEENAEEGGEAVEEAT